MGSEATSIAPLWMILFGGHLVDVPPLVWNLRGGPVLCIACYLRPGLGVKGGINANAWIKELKAKLNPNV